MAKSLVETLLDHGIELEDSSSGRKVAKCPFHEGDNDPSFTVYPTNTYSCFGCDVWGDAYKFLLEYKHMSPKDAMDYLGEDYRQPKSDKLQVIKIKNTVAAYKFIYDIAEEYHQFLLQTPGAIGYFEKRGLTMDTIVKYKLGYSDGAVLNLSWAWERELARDVGVMTKNEYEMLSHRVTIPNLTEPNEADFIIGRTVTNDKLKYLGIRVPKPIQGFYEVRHSPVLFAVEGQMDWLTLRQWGYPAIALSGSHLSDGNLNLIRDKRIVIVPDLDDGEGMKTANRLTKHLGESAVILDYAELKTTPGKFDISALAESKGGQMMFDTIVKEQLPWLMYMSTRILNKWFPPSIAAGHLRQT